MTDSAPLIASPSVARISIPSPPMTPPPVKATSSKTPQTPDSSNRLTRTKSKKGARNKPPPSSPLKALNVVAPFDLLSGEYIAEVDDRVTYLDPLEGPALGSLIITNFRCVFKSSHSSSVEWSLGVIHKIEKIGGQTSRGENAYGLEMHCKDFRKFRFAHPQENHSRRSCFEKLQLLAFPLSNGLELFTFTHSAAAVAAEEKEKFSGWNLYDFEAEMKRQGVPNDAWRITQANKNYEISDTYPSLIAVPKNLTDSQVVKAAAFRSKGRLPALCWYSRENQATITRCSQPRVGITGKRCIEDETCVEEIMKSNPTQAKVQILDSRPRLNAVANQAKGLGTELAKSYPFTTLTYMNIGNIHVMRDSLKKLKDLCEAPETVKYWHTQVEASGWLRHVQAVLVAAVRTVNYVQNGTSVLVHCSDGWDRTPQMTALAMLLLDPYYRTVVGFEVLIEKEWLSFGHKFDQRIGHGNQNAGDEQRSPIFVQFLDCVWQIMEQFPCAFEFNSHFLVTILDEMYSCRFGTFLYNSESKRAQEQLQVRTVSLWSYLDTKMPLFQNSLFDSSDGEVLNYVGAIKCVTLWSDYYLRDVRVVKPTESIALRAHELDEESLQLQQACRALESQLANPNVSYFNVDLDPMVDVDFKPPTTTTTPPQPTTEEAEEEEPPMNTTTTTTSAVLKSEDVTHTNDTLSDDGDDNVAAGTISIAIDGGDGPATPTTATTTTTTPHRDNKQIHNMVSSVEILLAIDYVGDSARMVLHNTTDAEGVCLTDNWWSGYQGDGAMQVGLTYLGGEHPALLSNSANLTLNILPLKKTDLETDIYVRNEFWPTTFGTDGTVLKLDNISVIARYKVVFSTKTET
eukprot:m.225832 g.225832  ORF g.225832 m.225832 type:complete len:854 (-) comp33470_c6_seq1:116-2677(-)